MWISDEKEHLQIVEEIEHSPDRTAAIVACAFLEESLKERLKFSLRKSSGTVESMLGFKGSLGSLFAKNQLAYAMEIYEDDTRHNIDTIAQIRNVFAHRTRVVSFKEAPPRKLCAGLRSDLPDLMPPFIRKAGEPPPVPEPRDHFIYVVKNVLMTLLWSGPGDPPKTHYVHVPSPHKSG